MAFDELNVLQEVDGLYAWLNSYSRERMEELFYARFEEVYYWQTGKEPDEDIIDSLVAMEFAGLLEEPNPVTHYTYATEIYRKRDRCIEAIQSSPTKTQKQIELQKQIKHVLQQISWYIDFTSQDAEHLAYTEADVKKVKRHEVMDSRTCSECKSANGAIYRIDNIPPIPHLRCRRWFTPV